jgi:hypothetical protein
MEPLRLPPDAGLTAFAWAFLAAFGADGLVVASLNILHSHGGTEYGKSCTTWLPVQHPMYLAFVAAVLAMGLVGSFTSPRTDSHATLAGVFFSLWALYAIAHAAKTLAIAFSLGWRRALTSILATVFLGVVWVAFFVYSGPTTADRGNDGRSDNDSSDLFLSMLLLVTSIVISLAQLHAIFTTVWADSGASGMSGGPSTTAAWFDDAAPYLYALAAMVVLRCLVTLVVGIIGLSESRPTGSFLPDVTANPVAADSLMLIGALVEGAQLRILGLLAAHYVPPEDRNTRRVMLPPPHGSAGGNGSRFLSVPSHQRQGTVPPMVPTTNQQPPPPAATGRRRMSASQANDLPIPPTKSSSSRPTTRPTNSLSPQPPSHPRLPAADAFRSQGGAGGAGGAGGGGTLMFHAVPGGAGGTRTNDAATTGGRAPGNGTTGRTSGRGVEATGVGGIRVPPPAAGATDAAARSSSRQQQQQQEHTPGADPGTNRTGETDPRYMSDGGETSDD